MNSALPIRVISSLTIAVGKLPPKVKSERLITPETLTPVIDFLFIGLVAVRMKASNSTDLVTPCMVKSPVTLKVLSLTFLNDLLLKVSVGNLAASKKSGEHKCSSRFTSSVLMLLISAVRSTCASE